MVRGLSALIAVALVFGGVGPASAQNESVCDVLDGAAWGLCNAYCEAMECDGDGRASQTACDRVNALFEAQDVGPMPCEHPEGNLVFVTSQTYTGNLSGLGGADDKCDALAAGANLPGTYVAWLSDSKTDAIDRLTGTGPFINTVGDTIADDISELTSGNLQIGIKYDEEGGAFAVNRKVWTGTDGYGMGDDPIDTGYCGDWTEASCNGAVLGNHQHQTVGWTDSGGYSNAFDQNHALYCFQQK